MFRIDETRGPRACHRASSSSGRPRRPGVPMRERADAGQGGEGEEGDDVGSGRHLFHPSHVARVVRTCFRRREGNDRAVIMILVGCMVLNMMSMCKFKQESTFPCCEFLFLMTACMGEWVSHCRKFQRPGDDGPGSGTVDKRLVIPGSRRVKGPTVDETHFVILRSELKVLCSVVL